MKSLFIFVIIGILNLSHASAASDSDWTVVRGSLQLDIICEHYKGVTLEAYVNKQIQLGWTPPAWGNKNFRNEMVKISNTLLKSITQSCKKPRPASTPESLTATYFVCERQCNTFNGFIQLMTTEREACASLCKGYASEFDFNKIYDLVNMIADHPGINPETSCADHVSNTGRSIIKGKDIRDLNNYLSNKAKNTAK